MAKRIIDWAEVGSTLVMSKYNGKDSEGETLASEKLESFELNDLFTSDEFQNTAGAVFNFGELTPVQKFIFVYGIKQKLADAGSSEKLAEEKAKVAREKFDDFVSGRLNAPRANGTGAKANKALADKAKLVSSECTLKGLMTKQVLFPDEFTEEDQEKLDEFLQLQMEYAIGAKSDGVGGTAVKDKK